MTKEQIKNKLLKISILEPNLYFYKYVDLVYNNEKTVQQKFVTQKHHIVPRCYYKNNGLEQDNSESNLVNLSFKDHLIAHCYLLLCSKDKRFSANMFYAICFISNLKINSNESVINLLNSELELYQVAYETGRKLAYELNPMFDPIKKANHDQTMCNPEVSQKISNTMKQKYEKGELFNDKHRDNLSSSAKLRCHAYKDNKAKRILKSDAEQYVQNG